MPKLIVEKGPDKGKVFAVAAGGTVTIGRDATATGQIHDMMCSRHHFRIEGRDAGYWLVDLGSMNGTLVNGKSTKHVKEQKLEFGDLIKVGETLLSFVSDETAAGDPLVGQRLGGYRVIERVGRGGMGTVYKAEQVDLQRIVALKVLSSDHAKVREFTELFIHEARAAAKLNHPNIVQVYDVGSQGALYYFSMEFVPGGSVQERLDKSRRLSIKECVNTTLEAARGLEYAHRKEIIHRDIKPDNLMISESGSIKIGDLGLAQRLGEKLVADDENSVIGTPHYIAPELVLGKPADFRSDIYSLGSTLYRMAAGVSPYQATNVRDLINKKVREDALPLTLGAPDVPPRLSEICARMMARKPEDRHASMTEVIADLERFREEIAARVTARRPAPAPEPTGTNRALLVAAVLLLAVVAVGGVIGAAAFMNAPAPAPPLAGPPQEPSGEAALLMLQNAKAYELQHMRKEDVADITRAIGEYESVATRYPQTEFAVEAAAHAQRLRKLLKETKAAALLREAERADRENWIRLLQGSQRGSFDLGPIDATIAAYQALARDENAQATTVGEEAARRAAFIQEWRQAVAHALPVFETARDEAIEKRNAERFNEAWAALEAFIQKAVALKKNCPFASDRYGSVLVEEAARQEQKHTMDAAAVAYRRVEERIRVLERDRKFEEALQLLETVARYYPKSEQEKALARQDELSNGWARFRAEEAQRAAREAEMALAADAGDFEKFSRELRRDVLNLDFRAAAARAGAARQATSGFPRTAKMRTRLERRAAEMSLLADFKDTLCKIVNDPRSYPAFKRDSKFAGVEGVITEMTEKALTIRLKDGGGAITLPLKDLKPDQFHRFVRGAYRWTAPKILQGLALYCCEFGLYEAALEDLAAITQLDVYKSDPALAGFVAAYREMLDENAYTDADEIEAEKRYARLKQFMTEGKLEPAREELDLLRGRFSGTRTAIERRSDLESILAELDRRGGDDFKRKTRAEIHKKIQDHRVKADAEASAARKEIQRRLYQSRESVYRDARLGEFLASYGDWSSSTEHLYAAKRVADTMLRDRANAPIVGPSLGTIYLHLHRNLLIAEKRPEAEAVRQEFRDRFGSIEGSNDFMQRMLDWERRYAELKDLARLERALAEAPEDPERLWRLAEACVVARRLADARGYLRALIELFPDAAAVRAGEAAYQLAEVLLSYHDLQAAHKLFLDVQSRYPEHPMVRAPGRGFNREFGVERRQEICVRLMRMLGIEIDGPPATK